MFSREKYRKDNRQKCLNATKRWRENNKEYIKEYMKKWREDNIEHILEYNKANEERIKECSRQHRIKNKEKIKKWYESYYFKHKDEIIKRHNKWSAKKYKTDLRFNLNCKMRTRVRESVNGSKNGRRWESLVGYTCNALIEHLKKTMPKGYYWKDYMDATLEIDHIIPISAHNYTKSTHVGFKRCWALKNLRLLPARENKIKGSKLSKPFQPTLKLGGCYA